jgi:hypothetical protein
VPALIRPARWRGRLLDASFSLLVALIASSVVLLAVAITDTCAEPG